jgi:hypothetical protein
MNIAFVFISNTFHTAWQQNAGGTDKILRNYENINPDGEYS